MKVVQRATWIAVGLAICMFHAPQAKAGIGFQQVPPEELKMTSEPLAPGAPAIISYRQVDRDDNVHTGHQDNYFRIKILTEEGRKNANVELPFVKGNDDVVNVRARTIEPDGTVVNFDGKVYEKELVKGRSFKYRAKTFTLSDVRVGSIIEYFYTSDLKEHYVFDSQWILSDELFTKKARFSLKPFLGENFNPFSVRWTWQMLPAGTVAPTTGPDGIVRMEVNNVAAFQIEDHMPPMNELKSRVDFIYEQGFAQKDEAAFWRDFNKKRHGESETFVGKHKAMEEAARQIVSPNDSQEEKLHKIYARVQKIRNTSYEPRRTEQELKREKPSENVEEVWKRGYGTGWQMDRLFLALVRAAGIEAYECLVSSRREYFFLPSMMQSRKLDSSVILVKLNGKDLYFDPQPFTPYGLLEWPETGVTGMRLDKDGGHWIQTTLPQASESRLERTGKLTLSDTGDLEGKLSLTFTGLEGMYQRLEERNADQTERRKYLEEGVASQIGTAAEAELVNEPDWKDADKPIVAEFKVKIPGWASNAGKRVLVPAAIFTASEKGLFEHANRIHPIYFEYPHQKLDDMAIELPSGWQIDSLPKPQERDAKAALYSLKVEQTQGTIHLKRTLSIDFLILDTKYYPTVRNFFQVVRTGDGEQIVVRPGEAHAGN